MRERKIQQYTYCLPSLCGIHSIGVITKTSTLFNFLDEAGSMWVPPGPGLVMTYYCEPCKGLCHVISSNNKWNPEPLPLSETLRSILNLHGPALLPNPTSGHMHLQPRPNPKPMSTHTGLETSESWLMFIFKCKKSCTDSGLKLFTSNVVSDFRTLYSRCRRKFKSGLVSQFNESVMLSVLHILLQFSFKCSS